MPISRNPLTEEKSKSGPQTPVWNWDWPDLVVDEPSLEGAIIDASGLEGFVTNDNSLDVWRVGSIIVTTKQQANKLTAKLRDLKSEAAVKGISGQSLQKAEAANEALGNFFDAFDSLRLDAGDEQAHQIYANLMGGINQITAACDDVHALVKSGRHDIGSNAANLGLIALFEILQAKNGDLLGWQDTKLVKSLVSNLYLTRADYVDASDAEAKILAYLLLDVDATRVKYLKPYRFGTATMAALFDLMTRKTPLQDDLTAAGNLNFHRYGCGRQLVLDYESLPGHHLAESAAKAIAIEFMDPEAIDQYKVLLEMDPSLPIKFACSTHFRSDMDDDPKLLGLSYKALYAVARARCVQAFVLRRRYGLYDVRANKYLALCGLGGEDATFNKVMEQAYRLLALAFRHIESGLVYTVDSLERGLSVQQDLSDYVQRLVDLPGKLDSAVRDAMLKAQDWQAGIPQVALYHHKNIQDGRGYDLDTMWLFHNKKARGLHKEGASHFRRKREARDEMAAGVGGLVKGDHPPKSALIDDADSLQLPAGIENSDVISLLRANVALMAWEAVAEQIPIVGKVMLVVDSHKKRKLEVDLPPSVGPTDGVIWE